MSAHPRPTLKFGARGGVGFGKNTFRLRYLGRPRLLTLKRLSLTDMHPDAPTGAACGHGRLALTWGEGWRSVREEYFPPTVPGAASSPDP